MRTNRFLPALTLLLALWPLAAASSDRPGSSDHPAIGRYKGSEIVNYHGAKFDELRLPLGPIKGSGSKPQYTKTLELEGTRVRIGYRNPEGRSTLEVFRNYEQELAAGDFEVLFSCKNEACGGRAFNNNAVPYVDGFGDNYRDQRYLAAKLVRPEGELYVSVYVCWNNSGDPKRVRAHTWLEVLEVAAMESGQVEVDADAMLQGIEQEGSVALYGITFDFNQARIRPASEPTLDEVARLLEENSSLRLHVVGHTDDVGGLESNLDLSRRRARAVVKALTARGVASSRLKPHGLAFLAPVASNRSEEGRAKNRRVVLLEQRAAGR
ncbi:MAG: flagellar motor protein MotB [Deltaproteobacteria bacterium]|jgi:outer membrane protein OmpA-like peptidoglycan-associated protein|nr:flagellar motor protein MotB [Deltaproteobacteria bacterium]